MPKTKSSLKKFFYSVGRRKESTVTVRLFKGKEETIVNGKPIGEYFPTASEKQQYQEPFVVTGNLGKVYATIKASGGGKQGQLKAVVLALARAIEKSDREKYRPILKKIGLLAVDSRVRERRKAGQMGRARKKKQSPKR